jgi:hypothetical protein
MHREGFFLHCNQLKSLLLLACEINFKKLPLHMRENISNWNDTIVALATAPGMGAIAIIRLSGANAITIVDGVFPKKNLYHPD